ncbi:putative mucin TcMUCII [Trypanosoma cruzi]|nr:putative mucin TcMUCII [Trypanosoma cruzi]
MMTCRLLCALLVLALCCCPLLCVADVTPEKAPDPEVPVDGKDSSDLSHKPGGKPATTVGEQGSPVPVLVTERRSEVGHGGGVLDSEPQPSAASNELQGEGTNDKKNTESGTSSSAQQRNTSEEDSAQKTTKTTTTLAPTTSNTTTTTQAPIATTNTEAPTTTTTRTQSRLSETDGSLSSSAWVCAPLLAVSALAYTTLG